MPKILTHVVAETQGDQLQMKGGWELEQVLNVVRVGPALLWTVVVSRYVIDDDDAAAVDHALDELEDFLGIGKDDDDA